MSVLAPTAFATLADVLLVGLPTSALGTLTTQSQQACVDWANGAAGSMLAGRFPNINTGGGSGWSWDYSVVGYVAAIAWKRILDRRGRNPSTANADKLIDDNYADAMAWFRGVQDQSIHPQITGGEPAGSTSQGPVMISSSVAWTDSGCRAANRGI